MGKEWFFVHAEASLIHSLINMISNNVSGIQSTKKRLKLIQHFKNKLLFLQET